VWRADRLVDGLVREGVIRDASVEAAFRAVRRHWFLPNVDLDEVYSDRAVVTHRGPDGVAVSSSSQPSLMARMLEQLAVEPGMAVLEIGTGTGYNAALLGRLVGPEGRVVSVDLDPAVTGPAAGHLATAGAGNVTVVTGDGWAPMGATFDRIEATVGVWDISPAWVEQLSPEGVLVAPLWLGAGQQSSVAFRKAGDALQSTSVVPCGFMRMRGPGAGQPAYHRIGGWTVTLDRPDAERIRALEAVLGSEPRAHEAPALERGWFTPIALREPDAVNLFTQGPDGPVVGTGLMSVSPPGLAIVDSAGTIRAYGSDEPLARLRDLVRRLPAIDPARLAITATPAGEPVDAAGALASLVRPQFTVVVRAG
jgi:protein-L-isoaspartate(D-aspartate) O-methyltransferase